MLHDARSLSWPRRALALVLAARLSAPPSRSGSKARRRRSSAPLQPTIQAGNALAGARRRQHRRRVLLRAHDGRRSATTSARSASTPAAGNGRLGLQGERRLAAGRRRQGRAEGRRRRALVLRHLRADRRAADARAPAARRPTATVVQSVDDAGKRTRGRRGDAARSTAGASGRREGRACVGRHTGLVRAFAVRRGSLERGEVTARRLASAARPPRSLAGCGGAGAGRRARRGSGSRATAARPCSSTRRCRPGRR